MQQLTRDAWLLFATRFVRLLAYGALSVVLVFYLVGLGLSEAQTGPAPDRDAHRRHRGLPAAHHPRRSDWTPPDAHHRRHADDAAGLVFASTGNWWLLLLRERSA
jgi:hypothetical protein